MLSKLFALVGQYFILMGKVFSRPEKLPIYRRRIIYEMDALGLNSIGLTAIISVFIGAVITLQMSINLESPFIPKYIIGYATRETMILEFSSAVVAYPTSERGMNGESRLMHIWRVITAPMKTEMMAVSPIESTPSASIS